MNLIIIYNNGEPQDPFVRTCSKQKNFSFGTRLSTTVHHIILILFTTKSHQNEFYIEYQYDYFLIFEIYHLIFGQVEV